MNVGTVGAWLDTSTRRLTGRLHTSEDARVDAELILYHITGRNRAAIMARPEATLDVQTREALDELLQRCAEGEPIAYIIGSREFWSMEFEVSPAVLIPRPDTELLVEQALLLLKDNDHPGLGGNARILDAGTGSGAVAVAIASECPNTVIATDVHADALAIARRNARRHLAPDRIAFMHGDWLDAIGERRIGLLVSNPPYIDPEDDHLAALAAEPVSALVAEQDGMADLERLIIEGQRVVIEGGHVLLEHGFEQGDAVRSLFSRHGYGDIATHRDLGGNERVTAARRSRAHQSCG